MKTQLTPWKKRMITGLAVVLILLCWYVAAWAVNNGFILPDPGSVLIRMGELILQEQFWINLLATLGRGMAGFILSLGLAAILALAAGLWQPAGILAQPLLTSIRSTPVISLILLALIWFGSEWVSVFIAILTMFPILCSSMLDGIKNTDRELILMARSYRVAPVRILRYIFLPSMAPFFFGGLTNAMGFGWRAIIIGEVLSQPLSGIGSRMKDAQNYLEVSQLMAWTVFAILISSLFEFLARKVEKRVMFWKTIAS